MQREWQTKPSPCGFPLNRTSVLYLRFYYITAIKFVNNKISVIFVIKKEVFILYVVFVFVLIALVFIGVPVVLGILLSKFLCKMVDKGRLPDGYALTERGGVCVVYAIAFVVGLVLKYFDVI